MRAFEDAHAQAVEGQLHAIAHGARLARLQMEHALEAARALGMAGREIEEGIPAAAPVAGGAAVDGLRALDDPVRRRAR